MITPKWKEEVFFSSEKPSTGTTSCVLWLGNSDVAHVAGNDKNGWAISLRQMKPLTLYPINRVASKSEAIAIVNSIFQIGNNHEQRQ